jgi:hypothetical protein
LASAFSLASETSISLFIAKVMQPAELIKKALRMVGRALVLWNLGGAAALLHSDWTYWSVVIPGMDHLRQMKLL